ncbi:MAG: hypothetical protein ABFR33_02595 [Verrucomicrobiota bacterium]
MELKLTPRKIARVLAVAMVMLAVLHIIACLPVFFAGRKYPLGFLSLDGESNLPSMFSVALLWCSALLAACIAWGGKNGRIKRVYWIGLSLAFFAVGLDEGVMIHERVPEYIRQYTEIFGLFYSSWVALYAVFLVLFIVAYARFFLSLPPDTRKHLVFAVLLYIGGAVGVEILGWIWVENHGKESIYYFFVLAEEVLEMSGGIAFIYTFSNYIGRHLPGLRLRIALD